MKEGKGKSVLEWNLVLLQLTSIAADLFMSSGRLRPCFGSVRYLPYLGNSTTLNRLSQTTRY